MVTHASRDRYSDGKNLSKAVQVAKCGNSVPPVWPDALVRSNLPDLCSGTKPIEEGEFIWTNSN